MALANESTLQNDAPAPFEASDERFHAFLQSVEAGEDYRKAWEELLATIPAELALRAEWGSRESVGAAALLASVPANANVLVVGSGLLGTAPALALLGMRVTIADASPGRLRFVKLRFQHLQYPEPQCEIVRGELSNIPDAHFDLVVLPDAPAGLPRVEHGAKDNLHFWIREAFRSLKPGGECVLLASNRFGYKRYTGLHGKFERRGGAFLRRVFSITNEELTPRGYARRLRNAGFDIVQRYVPYVSHLDYHNLVNVAADRWPRIDLGPQERKNLLKSAGYAAGLFQWLAPSVLLIGRKPGGAIARETLLNKTIRQYFSKTKNPDTTFRIEHLLATRGNAAIALVKSPAESLVFRVPLCPKEIRLGQIHQDCLLQFRKLSENIKIPRARGIYQFDGVSVFVESREAGMISSQHTGLPTRARTYLQLAEQLALLQIQTDVGTDALIENAVAARARMVAGRMRNPSVAKDILQISQNCAELLRGRR
ncbi:MAG: class I SAM-dependent methyltransferase, partial [Planctomycetota bacterium]